MFETAGSLAIVQPSSLPILLVLAPLAWASAWAVLAPARPRAARATSAACGAGMIALVLVASIRLAQLPHGHLLVQHVGQIARLGRLDLAFDLALAPRDAAFALTAVLVGAFTALGAARALPSRARVAISSLTASSAILVCAGDGLAPLMVGLGGLALASWALARGAGSSGLIAIAGSGAVIAGLLVLFGASGAGGDGAGGVERDATPRFVLVTTDLPPLDPGSATLSMTTYAGALVSSDDADLPGEPLVAPFSVAVPPGVRTLRVQPGVASADVVVPHVALVAGKTHVLAPYGPTTSIRVVRDQLAVASRADGERSTARAALALRAIDGGRAITLALLLMLVVAPLQAIGARALRLGCPRVSRLALLLVLATAAVRAAVRYLSASVRATDRVLVDAVPRAIARVARRVAPSSGVAEGDVRASTTPMSDRVRTAALGGMAALLALLVLSPMFGRGPIELRPSGGAFSGEVPIANEAHTLSLLLGVPLVGVILVLLAAACRSDDRLAHRLAVGALAAQSALAARVFHGFVPGFSRHDGAGGLQLVERAVAGRAIPLELHLGVDGMAATALLTTSLVALLAVLVDRAAPRVAIGYHATLLLLDASVVGALVAMNGLVLLVFLAVAIASGAILVATWGGAGRRAAAAALAMAGLVTLVALAVALVAVARHAGPTVLADGTAVARTFSLPDPSRASLDGATLLGGPLVKVAFALVLAASLVLLAAFPAHRWIAAVLVEAPPAAGVLVASALPTLGTCVLLRVGCGMLPDGARWASGVVVALGAVTAAYGALSALGRTELRTLSASAATAQSGLVLLGVGSLTAEGLSGAVVLGSTRALAFGAVLVLAAIMNARAGTTDLARLRGIGGEAPGWTFALAIAALGQAGVLGLGGAWGPALALFGAVGGHAPFAIASAIALVVLAAAHLGPLAEVAFGALDPAWRRSARLEPFGGRVPDATAREWTSVGPLVVLVVLLGVWPAPVVSRTTGTVRDLADTSWSPSATGQPSGRGME